MHPEMSDNNLVLPHEETLLRREISRSSFDVSDLQNVLIDRDIDRHELTDSEAVNDSSIGNNTSHHTGGLNFGIFDFGGESNSSSKNNSKNDTNVRNNFQKTDLVLQAGLSVMPSRDSTASLYSPRACPICLESYKEGDEIAWSHNEQCLHAFHLSCILDWLIKHDQCPMCQVNYLNMGETAEA